MRPGSPGSSEHCLHRWLQSRFCLGTGVKRMQLLSQTMISSSQRPNIFLLNRRSVPGFYSLRQTALMALRRAGGRDH